MDIAHLNKHAELVPELARLHFEAWGYLRPHETLEERTTHLSNMCSTPGMPIVLVALDAGQLLGSAMLKAKEGLMTDIPLTPWLAGVYVKSEYRSRGIAAILIGHIEALALRSGFSALHLCTDAHEAFYRRLGYQTTESKAFRDETVFIMTKRLA